MFYFHEKVQNNHFIIAKDVNHGENVPGPLPFRMMFQFLPKQAERLILNPSINERELEVISFKCLQ